MVLLAQRQGLSGSRPVRRPQEEEAGGRPGIPGLTMIVPTHPLLAEIVDQIADWDVPDGDVAQVLAPKALPSTAPCLMAQYRVPMRSDRHFGSSGYRHRRCGHVATPGGAGRVGVRPSGPLRSVSLRPKAEGAALLIGRARQCI